MPSRVMRRKHLVVYEAALAEAGPAEVKRDLGAQAATMLALARAAMDTPGL